RSRGGGCGIGSGGAAPGESRHRSEAPGSRAGNDAGRHRCGRCQQLFALPGSRRTPGGSRADTKLQNAPFTTGVIRDAQAFEAFATATTPKNAVAKDACREWRQSIDWKRELVVYVVQTVQSNRLTFKGWEAPKDGTGTLKIGWEGIEPFYPKHYPAVLCRVPRQDLQKIKVLVNDKTLAEIKLGPGNTGGAGGKLRPEDLKPLVKNANPDQLPAGLRKLTFTTKQRWVADEGILRVTEKSLREDKRNLPFAAELEKLVDFAK